MSRGGSYNTRLWLLGAGVLVLSCGPSAADMMRDAMVASDAMVSDASAQAGCATNCSASGTLRTLTADTDPAQLVRGGAALARESADSDANVEVVSGPLVLTDARMTTYAAVGGSRAAATLWIAPSADGCATQPDFLGPGVLGNLAAPGSADQPERRYEGARYFIGADESLCAEGVGTIAWAGFRPYE